MKKIAVILFYMIDITAIAGWFWVLRWWKEKHRSPGLAENLSPKLFMLHLLIAIMLLIVVTTLITFKTGKKRAVAILVICIVSPFLIYGVWKGLGDMIGLNPVNLEADDLISEAVYRELGAKELYYQGKQVWTDDVISYDYLIYKENAGQLTHLLETVNRVIKENDIKDKIEITCRVNCKNLLDPDIAVVLYNYSDRNMDKADYQTMKKCDIRGVFYTNTIYNNPEIYRNLPGITELCVHGKIAEVGKQRGINWYEYFPELERLELILPEE